MTASIALDQGHHSAAIPTWLNTNNHRQCLIRRSCIPGSPHPVSSQAQAHTHAPCGSIQISVNLPERASPEKGHSQVLRLMQAAGHPAEPYLVPFPESRRQLDLRLLRQLAYKRIGWYPVCAVRSYGKLADTIGEIKDAASWEGLAAALNQITRMSAGRIPCPKHTSRSSADFISSRLDVCDNHI